MRRLRGLLRLPRPARMAVGVALLVLGVLGLFLPVVQGLLFLAVGVAVLSVDVVWLARWRRRFAARLRRKARR